MFNTVIKAISSKDNLSTAVIDFLGKKTPIEILSTVENQNQLIDALKRLITCVLRLYESKYNELILSPCMFTSLIG